MSIGLAIGYDEQYERFAERDAAYESFYEEEINELIFNYLKSDWKAIDNLMEDVFDNITDDPIKSLNFGRLLFGTFHYAPGASGALIRFIVDEIDKIIKKRFNNLTDDE